MTHSTLRYNRVAVCPPHSLARNLSQAQSAGPWPIDETSMVDVLLMQTLYTGVTRGKRLVVLVGQKKAVAIAVRNISGRRRWFPIDPGVSMARDQGRSDTHPSQGLHTSVCIHIPW